MKSKGKERLQDLIIGSNQGRNHLLSCKKPNTKKENELLRYRSGK